ncbi:MAG: S9 family peptidase [Pseudomonadota bacterium]
MLGQKLRIAFVAFALAVGAASVAVATTVEEFVSLPKYGNVTLSPDGTHIAATTRVDGDAYMIIMNIEDSKRPRVVYQMKPINKESVDAIRWISNDRLLFWTIRTLGTLARPFGTGNVYAVNKDGKQGSLLVGPGVSSSFFGPDSIADTMDDDKRHVKIVTSGRGRGQQIEKINTFTAKRDIVDTSPFRSGSLITDADGHARFAVRNDDATNELYYAYRPTVDSEWVDFENPFEGNVFPLEIARDGSSALMSTNQQGRFGIVRLDLKTREITQVMSHDKVPVNSFMYGMDNKTIVGAEFLPGLPEVQYMEGDSRHIRLWKRLHASFPDMHVRVNGFTKDEKKALIRVNSDRQPTRYFLLDTESFSARYLFDVKPEIDAKQMQPKEAHWVTARDGVKFQLYVTRPPGEQTGPLPTVMVIHGGPHGPRDVWAFDLEAQLLASRGYVVIQPNYRGSGGFGFQFERSGYQKWGREMQDDVTDATLWAIDQGISDANKTCIYGGSYGGYATLAGITREPGLYACAFAFVGVYDLPMMKRRGDIPDRESGRTFLDQALGTDKDDLRARSPANFTDKIITPLYVAHGKADQRVPVQQYYNLLKKLDKSNVPYEKLLVKREGHGFYALKNRVLYYGELLKFLDKHIGEDAPGKAATTADAALPDLVPVAAAQ